MATRESCRNVRDQSFHWIIIESQGYHPAAVRGYLLTISNSNYEEWRMESEADIDEFKFTTEDE